MSHITPIKTTMKGDLAMKRALAELEKESGGKVVYADAGGTVNVAWEGQQTPVNFAKLTVPGSAHELGLNRNKDGTFEVKYGMQGAGKLNTLVGAKYEGTGKKLKCTRLEAIHATEAFKIQASATPGAKQGPTVKRGTKRITRVELPD